MYCITTNQVHEASLCSHTTKLMEGQPQNNKPHAMPHMIPKETIDTLHITIILAFIFDIFTNSIDFKFLHFIMLSYIVTQNE